MRKNNINLTTLEAEVKKILKKQTNRSIAHDFFHLKRVYRISQQIAFNEGADTKIVGAAALLHDLYRTENKERGLHAEKSADLAKQVLLKFDFNKKETKAVLEVIKEHSLLNSKKLPATLESLCLFEADKIDGLGAIGIARIFQTSGQTGWTIEETLNFFIDNYFSKYSIWKLKHTKTGRKIASKRLRESRRFLEELVQELDSKRVSLEKIEEVFQSLNKKEG